MRIIIPRKDIMPQRSHRFNSTRRRRSLLKPLRQRLAVTSAGRHMKQQLARWKLMKIMMMTEKTRSEKRNGTVRSLYTLTASHLKLKYRPEEPKHLMCVPISSLQLLTELMISSALPSGATSWLPLMALRLTSSPRSTASTRVTLHTVDSLCLYVCELLSLIIL